MIVCMIAELEINGRKFRTDFSRGINIALPVKFLQNGVNAYGLTEPVFKPFRAGEWVGSVAQGGSVNCEDILFNPHGNGTHTECYGHISASRVHVTDHLKRYHFLANLISVKPEVQGADLVITRDILAAHKLDKDAEALIIRTLPNLSTKTTSKYRGTNPPYFSNDGMQWIVNQRVKHLVVDLPSVDREADEGRLATHHIFWNYPDKPRDGATITELVYIPDMVPVGLYLLNLQIGSIESDATPSTPVIYPVTE